MIDLFKISLAHVKWFAEPVGQSQPYNLTDGPVMFGILGVIVIVLFGYWLNKHLAAPKRILDLHDKWGKHVETLATFGFGLAFVLFSTFGYLFAPNLIPTGGLGQALLAIQALAGVIIMLGFYERVGGLIIGLLYLTGIFVFGLVEMLDALEILGIAAFIILIGRPVWALNDWGRLRAYVSRFSNYAVPVLRVGTGLNLIILALSEKLLATPLTNDFLSKYDWNIMSNLGLHAFTDHWFAFYAGLAEGVIGIFLVLGLVTRLTVLALAGFLVTTLILLGSVELVGHLPHFSIAAVLLLYGSSKDDKLTT